MARDPIPTWYFALVVVRRGDRFLLVQEAKHDQLWYLPAGRVEPGESFADAAVRETYEESGIPVRLDGVLRVEHMPREDGYARVRVLFLGSPLDDTPPKTEPDEHSLRAAWVRLKDLPRLPLRGEQVRGILEHVTLGGEVYPLSLIQPENAPFERPD
jgi:phosphatase NudJ